MILTVGWELGDGRLPPVRLKPARYGTCAQKALIDDLTRMMRMLMMNEIILVSAALFVVSPLVVGFACNVFRIGQMIVNPAKFKLWHDLS